MHSCRSLAKPALWLGLLGCEPSLAMAQATDAWDVTRAHGRTREIDFVTTEGTWMSTSISPDGQWVLFDLLGHIYRVPVAGGEAECLTQASGVAINFHPRYSPDGNAIAFISDRAGQMSLWVMSADGSNPRPVILDPDSRFTEPTWTPDGRFIVAVRNFPTIVGLRAALDVPPRGREGNRAARCSFRNSGILALGIAGWPIGLLLPRDVRGGDDGLWVRPAHPAAGPHHRRQLRGNGGG